MISDKEKKIQEQRTIEATQKDLMGLDGKLGVILKNLGEPIIAQTEGDGLLEYQYYQDDDYEPPEIKGTPEEILKRIPSMYVEGVDEEMYQSDIQYNNTYEIGLIFDGLSRSINIEIRYLEENNELRVTYEGYVVYKEYAGELHAYVPGEWEQFIERLFPFAKQKEKDNIKQKKVLFAKEAEANKTSWLRKMANKWGF